ncbi:MAG: hypothetical protein V4693_18790 [Pseudomonadota bacterium]
MTVAACLAAPAFAQDASDIVLAPVEIRSKRNAGDMPYLSAYKVQQRLLSLLPPEPRVSDIRMRVLFTSLAETAQDDFMPATWAVAVVGATFEQVVPVSRGGYFLLPEVPIATDADATLMFNTQTKKKTLSAVWTVRAKEGNALPYRDFARAIEEYEFVRRRIGVNELALRQIREHRPNALRACFANGEGAILVDGLASGAVARGSCWLLKFDAAKGNGNAVISFTGVLAALTLDAVGNTALLPDAGQRTRRPEPIEELDPETGKIRW